MTKIQKKVTVELFGMSFPNPLRASWPRGTGTEPVAGAGPRTCLTPGRCSDRLLCEDTAAAGWCPAGAQPGSPGGVPGPTLLANHTCCPWDLANLPPSQPPRAGSCPLCPARPTGCDPAGPALRAQQPAAICRRTAARLRQANATAVLEHEGEAQPPPRAAGARHGSSREGRQSPVTSTGSTPRTGNCSLSTEIQQELFFWVLVRLQVTASSHNLERVIKVTWKMAGYIQNTDQVFPVKKRKHNTIQKTSLFSFQHFRSFWRYATLQPCQ